MDSRLDSQPGLNFLITEIRSGLSFARMAHDTLPSDPQKRERNRGNARVAYDTVLRFRDRVKMNNAASLALEIELEQLRTSLRALGERV